MIPPIKRGQKVTDKLLNRIVDQANRGGELKIGAGFVQRRMPNGNFLGVAPVDKLSKEPAHEVYVVNDEPEDALDAYSPVGIVASIENADSDLLNSRTLRVRKPLAEDAGNFVVLRQSLLPGEGGKAWISGHCLVRLFRWFDADILDTAEILADQSYVLATAGGSLDIVYEQVPDGASQGTQSRPVLNQEHYAICRFNGRTFTKFYNTGTETIPFGGVVLQDEDADNGLSDGDGEMGAKGVLAGLSPVDQDARPAFVNVGGPVEPEEYGRCTDERAMSATDDAYLPADMLGPVADEPLFTTGDGFAVLAPLGTNPTVSQTQYAVVRMSAPPPSNKILKIIDGQTVNPTLTYYGINKAAGQLTTVPSAYDPNGVGPTPGLFTAISGIGRAYLITNGALQPSLVLVCHDTRTGALLQNILVDGVYCQTWGTVSLLVGAGPATVTAYIPQPL